MAQISLSPESVEKFTKEKSHLVKREAMRMWRRCYVKTGVISYEDFEQEAYKALLITLKYFNKSKSPMAALDPYIVLGIQGELKNWIVRTTRQFNYIFDDPASVNNIPEIIQHVLPSFEDIEVLNPLSKQANEFLKCVFSPPPILKDKIFKRVTSGKPRCKNILFPILEWLGWKREEYEVVKEELQAKCRYNALLTKVTS